MNSEFVSAVANLVGALILTYYLSRLYLRLFKGRLRTAARVPAAHAASWLTLAVFVFWLEWFSVGAGLIYLGPQLLWFVIDRLQLQGSRS